MKTYTLEEATKLTLPALFDVVQGEGTVFVKDGDREVVVRFSNESGPAQWIPPVGYYADIYTPEDIADDNRLAAASVVMLDPED
jgi:hypothetical protein